MSSFHIDVRLADKTRHRRYDVTGALGEACIAALDLADQLSSATLPEGEVRWVDLYEGDRLHISISITPGTPLDPSRRQ